MMPGSVSFDDIRNLICSHLHQNIKLKYCNPRSKFMISCIELDSFFVSVHECMRIDEFRLGVTVISTIWHKNHSPCLRTDLVYLRLQVFQSSSYTPFELRCTMVGKLTADQDLHKLLLQEKRLVVERSVREKLADQTKRTLVWNSSESLLCETSQVSLQKKPWWWKLDSKAEILQSNVSRKAHQHDSSKEAPIDNPERSQQLREENLPCCCWTALKAAFWQHTGLMALAGPLLGGGMLATYWSYSGWIDFGTDVDNLQVLWDLLDRIWVCILATYKFYRGCWTDFGLMLTTYRFYETCWTAFGAVRWLPTGFMEVAEPTLGLMSTTYRFYETSWTAFGLSLVLFHLSILSEVWLLNFLR